MYHEQVEAERGNRRLDPDLGRAEPILQLAAVEKHLQRADRQAQGHKPEEVERLAVAVARLANEDQNAGCGEKPKRNINEEHPTPAVVLGEPTAEGRADNRTQYDPHAPDRHCTSVP